MERLSDSARYSHHGPVADGAWEDATIIMEALFDIRSDTGYIIELLEGDDGEEEAEDA